MKPFATTALPQLNIPDALAIDPALVLDIFGQPPIAFHRCYIALTGSVTTALWLAYAIYHINEFPTEDGWFSKSQPDWELETGLSRREQESARKRLIELGLLSERRPGLGQPLQFCINAMQLAEMLQTLSSLHWVQLAQQKAEGG